MTIKRMLENKIHYLTFRMFPHTSVSPKIKIKLCTLHFTHLHFTHFISLLQQNNLDYVDPQIANLLFEAGQSLINIGYNI